MSGKWSVTFPENGRSKVQLGRESREKEKEREQLFSKYYTTRLSEILAYLYIHAMKLGGMYRA